MRTHITFRQFKNKIKLWQNIPFSENCVTSWWNVLPLVFWVSYSRVETCQMNGIFQSGISHRNVLPCSFHGLQICCHLLAGCVVALLRSGSDAIMELRITILKHRTCFTLFFFNTMCSYCCCFFNEKEPKKNK